MKKLAIVFTLALSLVAFGCATTSTPTATAVMAAKSGSSVSGTVTFEEIYEGTVRVTVDLHGVPPGVHGFHIHENGDCSADDGTSAGGHFNPIGTPHAGPGDPVRHAGDLGNVTAAPDGTVQTTETFSSFTLSPGATSAAGRGLILHAGRDDLTTQPTGGAGGRIACGVITLNNAK